MKNLIVFFLSLSTSFSAFATDSDVSSELVKVETGMDLCSQILATNKLIQQGDQAVEPLMAILNGNNFGLKSKVSAAMALGEIGNAKALPALATIVEANKDNFNFWMRDTAVEAIAKIQGKVPKSGKFYMLTIGVQKVKTDCESGKDEIVP